MWYLMEQAQEKHNLSDRLIRAIGNWKVRDSEEDIDALISLGADVNRRHGTLLPLQCACCIGDWQVLKLLIARGAKVNEVDGYNRTALHYAAEQHEQCVKILLENGALIDKGDGNGDTALHWAAYKNNARCVKQLLVHGANINAVDLNNDTPVSWAARKGNLEVIKILLDFNADVGIKNIYGNTALQKSAANQATGLNNEQDDTTLELLIKASGQFSLANGQGELFPVVVRDNRINEILFPLINSPRSLVEQCRHRIRHSLGQCFLPDVIPTLPLPRKMKDFLLLTHDNPRLFAQEENTSD